MGVQEEDVWKKISTSLSERVNECISNEIKRFSEKFEITKGELKTEYSDWYPYVRIRGNKLIKIELPSGLAWFIKLSILNYEPSEDENNLIGGFPEMYQETALILEQIFGGEVLTWLFETEYGIVPLLGVRSDRDSIIVHRYVETEWIETKTREEGIWEEVRQSLLERIEKTVACETERFKNKFELDDEYIIRKSSYYYPYVFIESEKSIGDHKILVMNSLYLRNYLDLFDPYPRIEIFPETYQELAEDLCKKYRGEIVTWAYEKFHVVRNCLGVIAGRDLIKVYEMKNR